MSKTMTPEEVQAYLDKFKLPDVISTAVNNAVRLKAPDPYSVIATYLNEQSASLSSTAQEEDDYDDADDDIIKEGDEPVRPQLGNKRRSQVMAAAVEIDKDWKPPEFPKNDDQREFLEGVMRTNKLMKNLAPSDRVVLVKAFEKKEFEKDVAIIKQGDAGDKFYVVESGQCDITVQGKGSVSKVGKGLAFGELALLHNAPRAATVTTMEPCVTWALDMITFKSTLMGKTTQDDADYVGFLNKIEILSGLADADKQTLATRLREVEYAEGDVIIKEGDVGNAFYIIRDGQVKCTKQITGATEVSKRLERSDYFGHLALLSNETRAATVTATTKTFLLSLERPDFERILGPLGKIIQEAASKQQTA